VICGFQLEVLFGECYWHLGSFWSCCWTVVDDCAHRSEVVVSLPFCFKLHG
jgi:hypothetical protein